MWHSSAHPAACFTWAGWKKVSQRGQNLYQVMLRCVKVMSLAELTRLKEQVPFLEGRVWEEVKSPEREFAALHYNSEQEAEKALARTSTQARVVDVWVATARLFLKSPPFSPSIAMRRCYLWMTVVAWTVAIYPDWESETPYLESERKKQAHRP